MFHYILGLRQTKKTLEKDSEFNLYYFMEYTDDDIQNAKDAKSVLENKMWPTTFTEIREMFDLSSAETFDKLVLSSRINKVDLYLFYSEYEITEDIFNGFIMLLNMGDKTTIEQFKKAKIY